MPTVIFDTDVLIWHLRGNSKADAFIARTPFPDRYVSALSVMELIEGCRDKGELKTVREFLGRNFSETVTPDERICEKAVTLLERHALADGLRTIDALVAATALVGDGHLATANVKHFRVISGLHLLKFSPGV